jgi:uncharacterized protein YpmB
MNLGKYINKMGLSLLIAFGILTVFTSTGSAQEKEEKTNAKLAKQAKISMAQAREIAQKTASGTIEGEELERENGKLLYSFDIRNEKGTITEVQVDAKTGKLLSSKEETAADEAKEKREDKMKAKER